MNFFKNFLYLVLMTSLLVAAPTTNLKVLFIGENGGAESATDTTYWANMFRSKVYADITTFMLITGKATDGQCNGEKSSHRHLASNFYINPQTNLPYDAIILTGPDGSTTCCPTALNDVHNLCNASNGVNSNVPQLHMRCSHQYKSLRGYYPNEEKMYQELMGIGSYEHDDINSEGIFRFDNTTSQVLENIQKTNITVGSGHWCGNANGNNLYKNDAPIWSVVQGDSVTRLIWNDKQHNIWNWCQSDSGEQSYAVAWTYKYKANVRMFTETIWDDSHTCDNLINDIRARALIYICGKTNNEYLREQTPPPLPEAIAIPAKIEAEAYTTMNGIQTEPCSEGTSNVGWVDNGDWLDYKVTVLNAGQFNLDLRYSQWTGTTGSIQIKNSTNTVLSTVSLPSTNGWQNWATITSSSFDLPSGVQTIRLYCNANYWNLNWIQFNSANCVAPTIITQPSSQLIPIGSTATFSVSASGTSPLTYQWKKNVVNLSGANSSSYTTSAITTADNNNSYSVYISNACGNIMSSNAILTIPVLNTIPAKIEAEAYSAMNGIQTENCSEGTLNVGWTDIGDWLDYPINVTTSGQFNLDLRYSQWTGTTGSIQIKNSLGVILSTVTLPSTNGWQNWATITSTSFDLPSGSQTIRLYSNSNAWNLNWIQFNSANCVAPTITTQPVNQTAFVGSTAIFSVVVSGSTSLTYQWKKNGVNLSGANSSSYTTPTITTADNNNSYTVRISNSCGEVTSNAAILTVLGCVAPSITTQPVSQSVSVGSTVTFSATVNGSSPLTYQWKKNGVNISGANSSSYTTPAVTTADNNNSYNLYASNSCGEITSNTAILTINACGNCTNKALNKPYQAGSNGYNATLAFDGNLTNNAATCSNWCGQSTCVACDLGSSQSISSVKIYGSGTIQVLGSNDASTWTQIGSASTSTSPSTINVSGNYRYVKVHINEPYYGNGNWGVASINEIEVY